MIQHICGLPAIDDGIPNTFYYDESCRECLKIRTRIMRAQMHEIAGPDKYIFENRVERRIACIEGRDLAAMIEGG